MVPRERPHPLQALRQCKGDAIALQEAERTTQRGPRRWAAQIPFQGSIKKKWLAARGVLILSAFLLLLFSKFFLPFVSPFREGEKPPTSWLKWLKQLLISVRVQSRLQTVSGQRFLEATACTNFHLFRSFLLPGASGPSQELSPPEPHRTARKLVRAFQKKSSINEAGDPTVWLTHGNNVPALEVTLWNLTSGEPSPLQAATEFEESTWHCFNYG